MAEYSRIAKGHVTNPLTGSSIIVNLPFQPEVVEFWNYTEAAAGAAAGGKRLHRHRQLGEPRRCDCCQRVGDGITAPRVRRLYRKVRAAVPRHPARLGAPPHFPPLAASTRSNTSSTLHTVPCSSACRPPSSSLRLASTRATTPQPAPTPTRACQATRPWEVPHPRRSPAARQPRR